MDNNMPPFWVVLIIVIGIALGSFIVGMSMGRSEVFSDINDGHILFLSCQEITTTKTVQGAEFATQEWYCVTGE